MSLFPIYAITNCAKAANMDPVPSIVDDIVDNDPGLSFKAFYLDKSIATAVFKML